MSCFRLKNNAQLFYRIIRKNILYLCAHSSHSTTQSFLIVTRTYLALLFRDTFIIVGGGGQGSYSTIIEYDPKTEGWITWEEELGKARHHLRAMMVDSALLAECKG
jgi:hypothetical protein